jgi:DNA gyrase subunit A
VINIDANERNGDVVGMKIVNDTDEMMLITEKGILIRTRVSGIRETGRNAAGVRLIKLDDGDKLVAMAKVEAEEGDTEVPATEAEPSPEPSPEPSAEPPPPADGDAR